MFAFHRSPLLWVGGDGRKQLLLTPNGGVLRIIDSTLGGEVCLIFYEIFHRYLPASIAVQVCVVRPHFSLEYTLMVRSH